MYRERPYLKIKDSIKIITGYENVIRYIYDMSNSIKYISFETYPGVMKSTWIRELSRKFNDWTIVDTDEFFYSTEVIENKIKPDLTDDKVFGRFSHIEFEELLDRENLSNTLFNDKTIFIGILASEIVDCELNFYIDVTRWEIQKRYKKDMNNWKSSKNLSFDEKIKRSYYFEWPAADYIKKNKLEKFDYYIDSSDEFTPNMVDISDYKKILLEFTKSPFRLVPFFAPGVWGGDWIKKQFNLDYHEVNLAWGFDGVPEENSIIAKLNNAEIEIPAQNLVFMFPKELLGIKVFGKYGSDFPIRFDFLDTMNGQNLSLQVHPDIDYAYRKFGAKYTQNESYYIFHADKNSSVYLGVKNGVQKSELVNKLKESQKTNKFDDEKFINNFPVKTHDHISIPAGTIHSSGKDTVVLEISSTPNRFTFKLWDWDRLDLNGKPRPISLHHGKNVINVEYDKDFVKKEFFNNIKIIEKNEEYVEEKTGLYSSEDIETRRLTFSNEIIQSTHDSVNMLNLVEGSSIVIKSLDKSFDDFRIFYGETFIIPEKIKKYILKAENNEQVKVIKAFIR